MLKRYTLPDMRELWLRPETKFEYWLRVELAFLQARVQAGDLKREVFEAVEKHAKVNVDRINELESEYDHDMIAFVIQIQESLEKAGVGKYKEEFHRGLTSYDVEDPALVLMLRETTSNIIEELIYLAIALEKKAEEHKWTLMIARTHGQFAEPDTLGHLLLVFQQAILRSVNYLKVIRDNVWGVGGFKEAKISGAVGNYGDMRPGLEEKALANLSTRATAGGLDPAIAETQILQRDRHAMLLSILAVAAGSIEQMCRTFWEMMRSDVGELREPRKPKQRGSSAMAHKRNPILTERLLGAARMVRACAHASLENIATPEGRDISQSNVEREIFPTATSLLHYMAHKAKELVEGLEVFPERMKANLEASKGTWASQRVRNALMEAGVSYNDAYLYLQRLSFMAESDPDPERGLKLLLRIELISKTDQRTAENVLGIDRLWGLFDPMSYIKKGIEKIFFRYPKAGGTQL